MNFILGIDASNIRGGGTITHLKELLNAAHPDRYGISKVVVWGGGETLEQLPVPSWLKKISPLELNQKISQRIFWQMNKLASAARSENCDLLFVPGGYFTTSFRPIVTMSQNMLPFKIGELLRYGLSWSTFKMLLLRYLQAKSFTKADGVIFLTQYAKDTVQKVTGNLSAQLAVVSHGVNPRFSFKPKMQLPLDCYSQVKPFRLIYVSTVSVYKHQWHVVEAIKKLRIEGFPVVLDLIGGSHNPSLHRLNKTISQLDPDSMFVNYHGKIPYDELHHRYEVADIGLFASSCENMPNILIEKMASGLPIACSDFGPMPEVLGDAGLYFNPEDSKSIANALRKLILSPEMRKSLIEKSQKKASEYSWERCGNETFSFLKVVYDKYKCTKRD